MNFAKTRKKIILKTQPYFSCKERHDKVLLKLKADLMRHEAGVKSAKARVAAALKTLETISLEIHEARKKRKEEPAAETDSVTQAIAKAQEDAVAREKAEQVRLEQEEAERKAEEAAAAAAAAEAAAEVAAEANAEAEAAAATVRDPEASSAAAREEEGDSPGADDDDDDDEGDESDALNESVDISEEDLRIMIQKKLDEDEIVSPDPTIDALIDGASGPPAPLDDDDGADPITV